jgi:ElaB/YqjD/DUF883 family membrane-anchored ribosome-binding protein
MNSNNTDSELRPTAQDSHSQARGRPGAEGADFVRRASALFAKLPSTIDSQMKTAPYATVAVAFLVGTTAGILLRSRILRSVASSAVSYAVVELVRTYLRQAENSGVSQRYSASSSS